MAAPAEAVVNDFSGVLQPIADRRNIEVNGKAPDASGEALEPTITKPVGALETDVAGEAADLHLDDKVIDALHHAPDDGDSAKEAEAGNVVDGHLEDDKENKVEGAPEAPVIAKRVEESTEAHDLASDDVHPPATVGVPQSALKETSDKADNPEETESIVTAAADEPITEKVSDSDDTTEASQPTVETTSAIPEAEAQHVVKASGNNDNEEPIAAAVSEETSEAAIPSTQLIKEETTAEDAAIPYAVEPTAVVDSPSEILHVEVLHVLASSEAEHTAVDHITPAAAAEVPDDVADAVEDSPEPAQEETQQVDSGVEETEQAASTVEFLGDEPHEGSAPTSDEGATPVVDTSVTALAPQASLEAAAPPTHEEDVPDAALATEDSAEIVPETTDNSSNTPEEAPLSDEPKETEHVVTDIDPLSQELLVEEPSVEKASESTETSDATPAAELESTTPAPVEPAHEDPKPVEVETVEELASAEPDVQENLHEVPSVQPTIEEPATKSAPDSDEASATEEPSFTIPSTETTDKVILESSIHEPEPVASHETDAEGETQPVVDAPAHATATSAEPAEATTSSADAEQTNDQTSPVMSAVEVAREPEDTTSGSGVAAESVEEPILEATVVAESQDISETITDNSAVTQDSAESAILADASPVEPTVDSAPVDIQAPSNAAASEDTSAVDVQVIPEVASSEEAPSPPTVDDVNAVADTVPSTDAAVPDDVDVHVEGQSATEVPVIIAEVTHAEAQPAPASADDNGISSPADDADLSQSLQHTDEADAAIPESQTEVSTDEAVEYLEPSVTSDQEDAERPKSPWTPSYSVTNQGPTQLEEVEIQGLEQLPAASVDATSASEETSTEIVIPTIVTDTDTSEFSSEIERTPELVLDTLSSANTPVDGANVNSPWTPSYSVMIQGSPLVQGKDLDQSEDFLSPGAQVYKATNDQVIDKPAVTQELVLADGPSLKTVDVAETVVNNAIPTLEVISDLEDAKHSGDVLQAPSITIEDQDAAVAETVAVDTTEPTSNAPAELEAPKSIWTPSYSVTTQGSPREELDEAQAFDTTTVHTSTDISETLPVSNPAAASTEEENVSIPVILESESDKVVEVTIEDDQNTSNPDVFEETVIAAVSVDSVAEDLSAVEELSANQEEPTATDVDAVVDHATVPSLVIPEDQPVEERPWTPSYSVTNQGSPLVEARDLSQLDSEPQPAAEALVDEPSEAVLSPNVADNEPGFIPESYYGVTRQGSGVIEDKAEDPEDSATGADQAEALAVDGNSAINEPNQVTAITTDEPATDVSAPQEIAETVNGVIEDEKLKTLWTPSYAVTTQGSPLLDNKDLEAESHAAAEAPIISEQTVSETPQPSQDTVETTAAENTLLSSEPAVSSPLPAIEVTAGNESEELVNVATVSEAVERPSLVITPDEDPIQERPKSPWTPSYSVSRQGSPLLPTKELDATEDEPVPILVSVNNSSAPEEQKKATSDQPLPELLTDALVNDSDQPLPELLTDALVNDAILGATKGEDIAQVPSFDVVESATPVETPTEDANLLSPQEAVQEKPQSSWTASYSVTSQGSPLASTENLVSPPPVPEPNAEEPIDLAPHDELEAAPTEAVSPEKTDAVDAENNVERLVASAAEEANTSEDVLEGPIEEETPHKSLLSPQEVAHPATSPYASYSVTQQGSRSDLGDDHEQEQGPSITISGDADEQAEAHEFPGTTDVLKPLPRLAPIDQTAGTGETLDTPLSPRARLESTTSSRFFPGGWFSSPAVVPEEERTSASLDTAEGVFTPSKIPAATPAPEDASTHAKKEEKKGRWCVVM